MEMTFDFTKVSDSLPDFDVPVLLRYNKKHKSHGGKGQKGTFLTQGYLHQRFLLDEEIIEWFDYTDRLIQNVNSKSPSSVVIDWALICE